MNFWNTSPFDADVDKATSPKLTSEDWGLILEICDKVGNSSANAKECLRSISKRLQATDPHIVVHAITLLDACSNNCGKVFHLEVASRNFEQFLKKLIISNRTNSKIYEKLKLLLKRWAEGDYKTNPQLNLIPSLYRELREEGHDFHSILEAPRKSHPKIVDPLVVTSEKEEEEIAKAIELSLKENKPQSTLPNSTSPSANNKAFSLYPIFNSTMPMPQSTEKRQVLALYDFEAVEDNELTFKSGEIINIVDDSDPNWWKGSTATGEGLFPSNFVTADLTVEPEQFTKLENSKKSVHFHDELEEPKVVKKEPEVTEIEINEQKMDRLLHLLHEADPNSDAVDPPEMLELEEQVSAMGPLIDSALEKVDKQHAQLTQLSSDAVDALNLYHMLMRQIPSYAMPKIPTQTAQQMQYSFPPQGPPAQGIPQTSTQSVPSNITQGQPQHSNVYQMYNGMPSTTHTNFDNNSIPRFPANIVNSDFMGATNLPSMNLTQHYQIPPNQRQAPTSMAQDMQQPNQNSIPYTSQGLPVQTTTVHPEYVAALSPGPPPSLTQQVQYNPPPSGQRLI